MGVKISVNSLNWGPCVVKLKILDNFKKVLLNEAMKTEIDFQHRLAGQIKKERGYNDKQRDIINVCEEELYANENDATGDVDLLDFVSNGFKCRRSHNSQNGSGDTYIYMAFAEHPFVSSEGVPVTAR